MLLLLIKNPAGANEAIRTLEDGGVPPTLVIALNDEIADGRDVSWIWDVDFEPLLERAGRIVASGERAAELGLRFTYAGFPRERLELEPDLERALERGLELTEKGGELAVLPTYTAMLALRAIATQRGLTPTVLGGPDGDPRGASLPGLPEHLRRSRQHRRPRAPCGSTRPRARRRAHHARLGVDSARTTCSMSAAARIGSRR